MVELISIAVIWSLCRCKIHAPSEIFSLLLLHYFSTCSKSKIKNTFKVNWMKLWRIFFLTNVCFLMWSIKSRCKIINKKKIFLWQDFLLRECLCVGNVSITHRGHLCYFRCIESYWLFTDFKVILHVPSWALLILGEWRWRLMPHRILRVSTDNVMLYARRYWRELFNIKL